MREHRKVGIQVIIDLPLLTRVEQSAEKEGISRSEAIRRILQSSLTPDLEEHGSPAR